MALGASALFGLVAILIFQQILKRRIAAEGELGQTRIICASTKIPAGTIIAQNHLKPVPYPTQHLQAGSHQTAQELIGKIAQVDIELNAPILTKDIAAAGEGSLKTRLREGYRAMSIRVDEATSVSGFATPGSVVDVGAVLTPSANSKPVSKVIVQNLRVLAIGTQTQARPPEGQQGRVGNTVTLEVTPAQGEMLALAGKEGSLYLTLRHPADGIMDPIPPVVLDSFVDHYKKDTQASSTASTSQPPTTNYPPWYGQPGRPSPTPSPAPAASPTIKMASIRIISADKSSEVTVRQ